MKKVFLPFFIFLLFFLACVEKESLQPVAEPASKITFETYIPAYVPDDNFWIEQAKYNNNFEICKKVSEENRSECYSLFAYEDLDACVLLRPPEEDDCLFHHATTLSKWELCSAIQNATLRAVCDQLLGPCSTLYGAEKSRCLAFYYNDSSYCEDENCLFDYAIVFKDPSICSAISRPDLNAACKTYLLNKDYCKEVQANNADFCYYFVATHKNQLHLCSKIYSNYYRLECAVYKAVYERNPSACSLMEYNTAYYTCLRRYAMEMNDVTGCLMIDYRAPSHNGCLYELAEKYRNPAYCVNITDSNMKTNCYLMTMGIENITYSLSDCMKIDHEVWREKCILRLAQHNKDSSLCKYLTYYYVSCMASVSGG
ncbi:MAG: hypothetical protein QXY61_00540 [Candidatus Anstonellales archaeon]